MSDEVGQSWKYVSAQRNPDQVFKKLVACSLAGRPDKA